MFRRSGILGLVLILVAAGLIIVGAQSYYNAPLRQMHLHRHKPTVPAEPAPPAGPAMAFRIEPDHPFVATAAMAVPGCVVDFRGLHAESEYNGAAPTRPGLSGAGGLYIILQAFPTAPDGESVVLDMDSIAGVDNLGTRLERRPGAFDRVLQLSGGVSYVTAKISLPSPRASWIKELSGTVTVGPPQATNPNARKTLPWRLTGIPMLGGGTSVFGRIAALQFTPTSAKPVRMVALKGPAADSALRGATVVNAGSLFTPALLYMASQLTSRVSFPLPTSVNQLEIRPEVKPKGIITVHCAALGQSATVSVWDNEPFVVLLPQVNGVDRYAVALRVSRAGYIETAHTVPDPPFPPPAGTPGGAIEGQVLVANAPFGHGLITLSIESLNAATPQAPKTVALWLDGEGKFSIPNLNPGAYRVALAGQPVTPPFSIGARGYNIGTYVADRFGVSGGGWHGTARKYEFTVYSGARITMPPLNWVSSQTVQSGSAGSSK